MAQPDPYELTYDFTAFQVANPTTPLPADKIEIEYNNISSTIGQILANLVLIQRDDGDLANGSVGTDQLAPGILTILGAGTGEISTVAGIAANVTTVAGIAANVTTVAGIAANVTTVAGIAANVTSVAGNATNINTVAGATTNINLVGGNITNVNTVAGISANVTSVAGNATNINTVAGLNVEITKLGLITGAISAVGAIDSDVTTVAGITSDVAAVAGITADVSVVAGIATNINAVAAIDSDVTVVAGIANDVTTVANNMATITEAAANIPQSNRTATTDPTVNDDSGDGYSEASIWVNTVSNEVFFCTDPAVGAAVWASVSGAGTLSSLSDVSFTSLANNDFIKYNGSAWVNRTPSDVRTDLGLVIGTNVQAYDAELAALAGLTSAANAIPVFTGSGTAGLITLTPSTLAGMGSSGNAAKITMGTNLAMSAAVINALSDFLGSSNTSSPNATVPVVSLAATNAATNVDVAIVPKGSGALALAVADSTSTGGNKRGQNAIDLQTVRSSAAAVASGNNSVAIGKNNTASAKGSVAIGENASATGTNSASIGASTSASATYSHAYGTATTANAGSALAMLYGGVASGNSSVCLSYEGISSGQYSQSWGYRSSTRSIIGAAAWACAIFAATADTQLMKIPLQRRTTGNTATRLTSDAGGASTNNQFVLQNNSSATFTCIIIGKQSGSSNRMAWKIEGEIYRGANAASTTIGSVTISALNDAGLWGTPTATADTTNGALAIEVTGAAATNIQWTASLDVAETVYS